MDLHCEKTYDQMIKLGCLSDGKDLPKKKLGLRPTALVPDPSLQKSVLFWYNSKHLYMHHCFHHV